jgi:LAS superfamily LD-carboxypeptidase LdcB
MAINRNTLTTRIIFAPKYLLNGKGFGLATSNKAVNIPSKLANTVGIGQTKTPITQSQNAINIQGAIGVGGNTGLLATARPISSQKKTVIGIGGKVIADSHADSFLEGLKGIGGQKSALQTSGSSNIQPIIPNEGNLQNPQKYNQQTVIPVGAQSNQGNRQTQIADEIQADIVKGILDNKQTQAGVVQVGKQAVLENLGQREAEVPNLGQASVPASQEAEQKLEENITNQVAQEQVEATVAPIAVAVGQTSVQSTAKPSVKSETIVRSVSHVSTKDIGASLTMQLPFIGNKLADKHNSNIVLPQNDSYTYEFYVEVDSSKKPVYDYLLKYMNKANAKKWFGFHLEGSTTGEHKEPWQVTLNYAIPPTRFSITKALYFYFRLNVGVNDKSPKYFYFVDNVADTNSEDAQPYKIGGIIVTKSEDKNDPKPESAGSGSQAVTDGGTLSEQDPTQPTKEDPSKTQEAKPGSESQSSNDESKPAKLVIDEINPVRNIDKNIIEIGETDDGVVEIGGGNDDVIKLEPGSSSKIPTQVVDNTPASIRLKMPKTGSIAEKVVGIGAGAVGVGVAAGAMAVGSTGQNVRTVTGDQYQPSAGQSFQSTIGTRGGATVIAGADSNQILVENKDEFYAPWDDDQFVAFQDPLTGVEPLNLELDGLKEMGGTGFSIGRRITAADLEERNQKNRELVERVIKNKGGIAGDSAGKRIVGGIPDPWDDNDSILPDNSGGNGGNLPPRLPRMGGTNDGLPDPWDDGETGDEEEVVENTDILETDEPLDFDNVKSQELQEDLYPNVVDRNGLKNLIRNNGRKQLRPGTGGRISSNQTDGQNSFSALQQRLTQSKINSNRVGGQRKAATDDIKGAARQAAKDAVGKFAQKIGKELAKKVALQVAGFFAGLLANPIALLGLVAIFLTIIFVGGVIAAECRPEGELKKFRDSIVEPAAWGMQLATGGVGLGEAASLAGGAAGAVLDPGNWFKVFNGESVGVLPASNLRKMIEALPGCSDLNANPCATTGVTGPAISGEYGTPTGKISASQCLKLREYKPYIDKASADYGVPGPIIGAIMSRESDVGEGNVPIGCAGYGDGGAGHGLGQIDPTSGAWGSAGRKNMPPGTPTTVKDINGQPFIWDNCESGIRYVAFHIKELEKLYAKDVDTAGPKGSKAWWIRMLAANNAGGNGAKNGDSSTTGKDYGTDTINRAADVVKCLGGSTAATGLLIGNNTAFLSELQKDKLNNFWSEAFGFSVTAKVNEYGGKQVFTGVKSIDDKIFAFNKVMNGKVSVEARVGSAVGNSKIDPSLISELKKLEAAGKFEYVQPFDGDLLPASSEAEGGRLNIAAVKLIIEIAKLSSKTKITGMNDGGHSQYSNHYKGLSVDVASITIGGKTYDWPANTNGPKQPDSGPDTGTYDNGPGTQAAVDFADALNKSGLVQKVLTWEPLASKLQAKGVNAIQAKNHRNHYHIDVKQDADSSGVTSNSSPEGGNPCPPCGGEGSTSGVGISTGDGTISKGGEFTPAVRAFLDTIAKWESEGKDSLSRESYNSGNFTANDFDAAASTDLAPKTKSNQRAPNGGGAYNIGRYQYFGEWGQDPQYAGDVETANVGLKGAKIDFVIKDFKPTSQDYYPLGKWSNAARSQPERKLSKVLGDGEEPGFKKAVEIGSPEWASMPFNTRGQPKATYPEYWAYYQKRLAVYKQTSSLNIFKLFGSIKASAAEDEAALRNRLAGLYEKGEVTQVQPPQTQDIQFIKSGADINLVKFLLAIYDSGIVWVGGPLNFGRNYGGHGDARAMDFWGFGYKSEFNGDKIKGYTWDGNMNGGRGSGAVPSEKGNEKDPRILRMIDINSPNQSIKTKVGEIYKKVVDLAYDNKAVDTKTNNTNQVFANTDFANKFTKPDRPIWGENIAPDHHHHLHISVWDKSTTLTFNVSPTSGGSSLCPPCPSPTTPTPTTVAPTTSPSSFFDLGSIFGTIKTIAAATRPTKYSDIDAKHKTFLETVAKEKGYNIQTEYKGAFVEIGSSQKMSKEAGDSFNKMKTEATKAGVDLTAVSGFRDMDDQVRTFFAKAGAGIDDPIPDNAIFDGTNETVAKPAYLARLKHSAVPGYSEHLTGNAIDIGKTDVSFETTPAFKWLETNAKTYKFSLTYPKGSTTGANYEPWHWYYGERLKVDTQSNTNCSPSTPSANLGPNSTLANTNPPANFIITDETGKLIKQINGSQAVAGASIYKVIIASVALKNNVDLTKQITLSSDVWLPDEEKWPVNTVVSAGDLLKEMLYDSNNTASNALMKEMGGIAGGFDTKAKAAGYNSVAFGRWFTASKKIPGNNESGKREASVSDTNLALIDLFKNSGGGYDIAKSALQTNPHVFQGAQNINAFKHGNTSTVLAVSAKLTLDGKVYYTTMIYNINSDTYNDKKDMYTFKSNNPITKFINDIKNELN